MSCKIKNHFLYGFRQVISIDLFYRIKILVDIYFKILTTVKYFLQITRGNNRERTNY